MDNALVDFIVKSIMIGDSGVGKTTISKKMTDNLINYSECSTIGIDYYSVNTRIDKKNIKLQIWDTAGNERFHNLVKLYFKNNAICYVVFDVCEINSFNNVQMWIDEFKNNSLNKNAVIVIVGNKIDNVKKRIVSNLQGKEMADKNNALYIEVSPKASVGLQRLIEEPLERVFELYNNKVIMPTDIFGIKDIKGEYKRLNPKTKTCCIIQ